MDRVGMREKHGRGEREEGMSEMRMKYRYRCGWKTRCGCSVNLYMKEDVE